MTRRIERFHAGNITPEMRELFVATTTRIKARRDSSPAMKALLDEEGRLNGPPSLWLLSPEIGKVFEALQGAIRQTISLSPRRMEIVILLVGGYCKSEFEIFAHRLAARAVGITDAEIEALVANQDPGFSDPTDTAVAAAARALLANCDLNDSEYAAAMAQIGARGVFEVTVLVGFYQALALQLATFRVTSDVQDNHF